MKRYWLYLFFICIEICCTSLSQAQSKFSFGPELGLAVNFYAKTGLANNTLLSSHLGIKSSYALSKNFSIQTGIYYSTKKLQYQSSYNEPTPSLNTLLSLLSSIEELPFDPSLAFNTNANVTVNGMVTAHFIEIPVLGKYQYKGIAIFAGPHIGFLSTVKDVQIKESRIPFVETINYNELAGGLGGAILSSLSPDAYTKVETTSTSKNNFNKYDLGFTAGLGYEFKHVTLNMAYVHGLLDYREHSTHTEKVSFKSLRFSISYLFHTQKKNIKTVDI